jgi:hypothetical protein
VGMTDATTAQKVIAGLRTSVHECGHMVDLNQKTFLMGATLEFKCDLGIASSTPGRKVIATDEFQSLWPKDSFKKTYLDELGDQQFPSLMTEALQYINTLATSYTFFDYTTFDPIARDGVHAFQWYVTRYLRQTRTKQPDTYNKIANDTCWRQLVLSGWGRAYRYLVTSKGLKELGSADDALLDKLMEEPQLVDEIDKLRVIEKCK